MGSRGGVERGEEERGLHSGWSRGPWSSDTRDRHIAAALSALPALPAASVGQLGAEIVNLIPSKLKPRMKKTRTEATNFHEAFPLPCGNPSAGSYLIGPVPSSHVVGWSHKAPAFVLLPRYIFVIILPRLDC